MKASTLPRGRDTAMVRLYACAMIVTTGLAVAAALLVTQTEPQYSSSAEILVGPTLTSSGNYIQPSMPTEQRVATSAELISSASAQLGVTSERPLGHLSVTVPIDTQVLVMTYTTDTAAAAALSGAKVLAATYLQARNPTKGDAVASLVSPPVLPSTPVGINYPVILGAAVLGGLLIGFVLAKAWDAVRGRIRTIEDAERCTGLDALAVMPRLPRASDDDQRIWAGCPPLDSLSARVLGQFEGGPQSTVLVTGVGSGCGSTAVAAVTALALARMGRVVLLVTADDGIVARMSRNRNPDRRPQEPTADVWPNADATAQEGLYLISVAGWDDTGIAAARLTCLLPELHDRLPDALIVIDGPPAWSSAGPAMRADKVLLVVTPGHSSRASGAAAMQALDHCGEKMMGLVINPRPHHTRRGFAAFRAWATFTVKRLVFRFGPLSGGLAPTLTSPPYVAPSGESTSSVLS